jgi:hypothetical protein
MKPVFITVTDTEKNMWDIKIDSISHYNELGNGITSIVLSTPQDNGERGICVLKILNR